MRNNKRKVKFKMRMDSFLLALVIDSVALSPCIMNHSCSVATLTFALDALLMIKVDVDY